MPPKSVIDIDGSDAVSKVLLDLLNQFPGLSGQNRILFSTLSDAPGCGFFPVSGACNPEAKNGYYRSCHAGLSVSVQCNLSGRTQIRNAAYPNQGIP